MTHLLLYFQVKDKTTNNYFISFYMPTKVFAGFRVLNDIRTAKF